MSDLPNYCPGYGNPDAKLMVIGMAPGQEENDVSPPRPMIGPAGKLCREMLRIAGQSDTDIYITNVEKYMPPFNKLSLFKTIGRKPFQDIELMWKEIEAIKPNCILVLGEHALKAVTGKKGIKKWRGSILTTNRFPDIKVVPTYHTSALLRSQTEETKAFSYSARAYMQLDFRRAVAQSKFRLLRLPNRQLEYADTSEKAERFFHQYKDHKLVVTDIETVRGACIPTCIGFAFNKHHGMSFPLLNVSKDFYMPPSELIKIWRMVQEKLADPTLLLSNPNLKFDRKKLTRPFGFKILAQTYFDPGMANHILYPEFPKALEFLTSVWTEEPYYKGELREYDPEKDPFTQVLYYNAKDVCVPFEIMEKQIEELEERNLSEFFFNDIMPLSDWYQTIEERGIAHDPEARTLTIEKFKLHEAELVRNLRDNIGYDLELGSYRKVATLLYDELGIPRRKNTKEDTLVSILATNCKDDLVRRAIVTDILTLRKVRRNINGPLKMAADYDGRMRTIYNINGTPQGRTSANILKPPERPTKVGMQGQNMSKHGEIGPEVRTELVPDKGKVFVQLDMSQAESRVCAALARDEWLLNIFANKKDVHSITASWYFDKENPDSDVDPINVTPHERFIGKTTRHSLTYFCQWKKLMLTVNKLAYRFSIPVTVDGAQCKGFRAIFLKKSPKIEEVFWREVNEAIKRDKKKLVASSGRERVFYGLNDPNLYYSWIPSTSVSDHNKFSAYRFNKRVPQLEILKEDHDSILFQCYESEVAEFYAIGREEYEKPIDLSRCSLPRDPIVIPCDIEIGYNYKDLRKWKPS